MLTIINLHTGNIVLHKVAKSNLLGRSYSKHSTHRCKNTVNKLALTHQMVQLNTQGHIGAISDNHPHNNYVFFHFSANVTTKVHIITSTQYVTTLRSVNYINHYVLTHCQISIVKEVTKVSYVCIHFTLQLHTTQSCITIHSYCY